MTLYTDTTPIHIIFSRMGRDLQKLTKYFRGPNQLKLDGAYGYETKIYDGNNHIIAACNIAGEGKDYTKEEREMAQAIAGCVDFVGKYNNVLEKLLSGELDK